MNYAEAIDFLYNLEHGSIKLGLERIEAAVAALDHPQRRFVSVHVAGTNGKGSTAAFLAAMAEAGGYKCALHTSPHLQVYGERFRIDGRMLPEETIAALATELKPLILDLQLSYFEATTALAFEAFAREGVQIAVIEVGMGGRLDATNVLVPALAVITGIQLDHTKSLGTTLEAIAGEKAGIVKPGVPLLHGPCSPEVAAVLAARCRELDAPIVAVGERMVLEGSAVCPRGTRYSYRHAEEAGLIEREIRLCGRHQVYNALLAEEGARLLSRANLPIGSEARAAGLRRALWPGRFEFAPGEPQPPIILDVAHNPGGGQTVVDTYRDCFPEGPAPLLIVGMLGDKDHESFLGSLRSLTDQLVLIPLDTPRAGPLEDIVAAATRAGFAPRTAAAMTEALSHARGQSRPVIITGSFRTVEVALRELGIPPTDPLYAAPHSAAADRGRDSDPVAGNGIKIQGVRP